MGYRHWKCFDFSRSAETETPGPWGWSISEAMACPGICEALMREGTSARSISGGSESESDTSSTLGFMLRVRGWVDRRRGACRVCGEREGRLAENKRSKWAAGTARGTAYRRRRGGGTAASDGCGDVTEGTGSPSSAPSGVSCSRASLRGAVACLLLAASSFLAHGGQREEAWEVGRSERCLCLGTRGPETRLLRPGRPRPFTIHCVPHTERLTCPADDIALRSPSQRRCLPTGNRITAYRPPPGTCSRHPCTAAGRLFCGTGDDAHPAWPANSCHW